MSIRRHTIGSILLSLSLPASAVAQSETKLVAGSRQAGDEFGIMCVTSGEVTVIGARNDDEAGLNAGAAYVFDRTDSGWVQSVKLMASDPGANDQFGGILELDGDRGNRIFVGALRDDHNGVIDSGSVYVFEKIGGSWVQTVKLVPSDLTPSGFFGNNIASDGTHVLIGALGKDGLRGAAYVFAEQNGAWVEVAKLTASDGAPDDRFGDAVALLGDTAVIGAPGDDGAGPWSGSAYVFHLSGGTWVESGKLVPADLGPTDNFASALDITAEQLIAGAREHGGVGAAYVYDRAGREFINETKLMASNGAAADFFGHDVGVSGQRILVGAVGQSRSTGVAYVFAMVDNRWVETQQLTASDGQPSDFFGHSVAIHGRTAVVGARGDDDGRGAAYVFDDPVRVDATTSTIDVSSSEIELGQQATITVTPRDAGGDPVGAGLVVVISTTLGTLGGDVRDRGDGTYSQVLDGSAVGTAEITAVADEVALEVSATLGIVDPMSNFGSVVGVRADGAMVPYPSIQSAVCAATVDGLQRVLVPPGDYDEIVRIHRVRGLSIEGLVSFGPVIVRGFRIARSEDLVIANFEVRETKRLCHGVVLHGGRFHSEGVMLANILVHGGSRRHGSGILIGHGNQNVTITNSMVRGVAGDGIRISGSGSGHRIHDSAISSNGHNGIRLDRKVSVTISGCEITDNGQHGRGHSSYGVLRQRSDRRHANPEMVTLTGNIIAGNHGSVQRGRSNENLGNYDQILDPTDDQ